MKKSETKIFYRIIALIILIVSFLSVEVSADYSKTEAQRIYSGLSIDKMKSRSYAACEVTSKTVVIEGNAYEHISVGNLVKLFTIFMAYDYIGSGKATLETEFPVTQHAQDVSVGKVRVYLDAGRGERITFAQAIEAVSINGATDCACALAEYIGGSEENFVNILNKRMKDMGLKDSYFTDSTGNDTEQYTCAHDVAVIMANLVAEHPDCVDFLSESYGMFKHTSTKQPDTEMVNNNPFTRKKFYQDSDGSMLGYTKKDGYSFAASVTKDGKKFVAAVLGSEDENIRAAETKFLLEYAVKNFEFRQVCEIGTYVKKIDVKDGKETKIKIYTAGDVYVILPVSDFDKIVTEVNITQKLQAPLEPDLEVGYVVYSLDGKELGRAPLVTKEGMGKANWFILLIRKILAFFGI